ncbi:biotin--protein ligase 2-like [Iris pallida]|uniref:Biotin--protein ligase 2-like n=1 Tax=Iris pallida TaxID=29817 RepID=A0AAX6I619_IRIPA|nr:biotin--protein ligase 2-like [Iris pallida]
MPLFAPHLPSGTIIATAAATIAAVRFIRPHLPSLRLLRPSVKHNSKMDLPYPGGTSGDSWPPFLVICCKSFEENALAQSLQSKMETLKLQDEEEVKILLHSEMDSGAPLTFKPQLYMEALSTRHIGRLLMWSPRLPSTHDVVSQNFTELPVGTVCVTDIQFKGRGRSKNVWDSPVGCLLFSFTLEMEDGRKLPLLQYVVSLAVTEAIKEACQAKGLPKIDIRIKWPNDLYLNNLKVGGILCTSTYRSKKFNVCAGIGLNLDNEMPTTCLNAVLKEISSSSCQLSREDILAAFFNKFEELFEVLLNQGFQSLEELYYKTWLHSGQRVVIEEKLEGQSVEGTEVTIQGLTSTGYLLATDEDNHHYELHPDGNSFDFFKGLVRRKLDY